MVSTVSKLANPWKCDAPGCGVLRAKDTNHWMIVRRVDTCLRCELHGTTAEHDLHLGQRVKDSIDSEIVISKWSEALAELLDSKHVCGVHCALRVAGGLMVATFFPGEPTPGTIEVRNE